tara:strand:+ start:90 stop:1793 length:1704 start_codon:yes stop_codon:yes gene_type:complete
MKNIILGLNAIGINTSASLIIDNKIISAIEEERLIRQKRTRKFPIESINYCLSNAKIKLSDLTAIAISWNPAINLEKFNSNMSQNLNYIPSMLHSTINYFMKDQKINKDNDYFCQILKLADKKQLKIYYVNHHLSHASNFYFSPFSEAAILTLDGFGENECMGFYHGRKNNIKKILTQNFPHSLGSFYSTITEFCGFKPQGEEWKLMGASSYGNNSKYYKLIRDLVILTDKGFELNLNYFNHYMFHRPNYFNDRLIDYLKTQPNQDGNKLNKKYFDIAYAGQKVFEDIYYHVINLLYKKNKSENLIISGGCALNCVANGKITSKTRFKNIFIPPVPDDSGAGLGAAYFVSNNILKTKQNFTMKHNYFGPNYSNKYIEKKLKKYLIKFTFHKNILEQAVQSIIEGKIIGWFQGELEFGDRALGNRSILADPRRVDIKDKINKKIKYREQFRPFAPAILEEKVSEFFEKEEKSVFMERALKIKKNKRSKIPSVTHIDGTGRLQTVNKKTNQKFYNLINEFYKMTNIPILLNTSFNIQGEPVVCSIEDALKNFYLSGLDELYIGDYLIKK